MDMNLGIGGLDDIESDSDDDEDDPEANPLVFENVSKEMMEAFTTMSVTHGGDPLHSKEWVEEVSMRNDE